MKDVEVAVFGATGIVGQEVVSRLERSDARVRRFSRRGRSGSTPINMTDHAQMACAVEDVDLVINLAASTRWTMTAGEAHRNNVATTKVLLDVAGSEVGVVHASTAYADGLAPDSGSGTHTPRVENYRNCYEWSKAAAEAEILRSGRDVSVVRFPLLIGDRATGSIGRFVGIYSLLASLVNGNLPAVIGDEESPVDLVPVSDAADEIIASATRTLEGASRPGLDITTVLTGDRAPRVSGLIEKFVAVLSRWRLAHGYEELISPPVVPIDTWQRFFKPFIWPELSTAQRRVIELLEAFEPYLAAPLHPPSSYVQVVPIGEAVERSVWYWAEMSPRAASRTSRAWESGG